MNDILFQDELDPPENDKKNKHQKYWKILVIDDDEIVHQVTRLVLADAEIEYRQLEIVSAFSSAEAKEILKKDDSFAMAFVDVVMETEHAGLELVDWIRNTLKNQAIRLILRTGQAGNAPEAKVIKEFDINDYKEKTDFTASKMITSVYAGIRAFRDIITIQRSLDAFKKLIISTHDLLKINKIKVFGSAALEHLLSLMDIESSALYIARAQVDFDQEKRNMILACTGKYVCESDSLDSAKISDSVKVKIKQAFTDQCHYCDDECFVGYYQPSYDSCSVLYIEFEGQSEHFRENLVELFATNVALILEGLSKQYEFKRTQKELLYIVGEAIEKHNHRTGHNVERIAMLCAFIANKMQLSEDFIEAIKLASALHDIGKISIPESIVNKPGKLNQDEIQVMQTHAAIGNEMLSKSTTKVSKLAASLAHYHHENWDGTGYPNGLVGRGIPIEARIMAVVDVFDALSSKLCYRNVWQESDIQDYFVNQRGKKFDPEITDLVLDNFAELIVLRDSFTTKAL